LFASYREAAGAARLETPLQEGATVQDLLDVLATTIPALKKAPGLVAVNHSYVTPGVVLHDADEVAFIPPVSGG
jgi:MoaE-MoaD fusion protein